MAEEVAAGGQVRWRIMSVVERAKEACMAVMLRPNLRWAVRDSVSDCHWARNRRASSIPPRSPASPRPLPNPFATGVKSSSPSMFDFSFSTPAAEAEAYNEPPTEMVCPITLSVMSEPVIAADGFSYEKQAISKWFKVSASELGITQTFACCLLTLIRPIIDSLNHVSLLLLTSSSVLCQLYTAHSCPTDISAVAENELTARASAFDPKSQSQNTDPGTVSGGS